MVKESPTKNFLSPIKFFSKYSNFLAAFAVINSLTGSVIVGLNNPPIDG